MPANPTGSDLSTMPSISSTDSVLAWDASALRFKLITVANADFGSTGGGGGGGDTTVDVLSILSTALSSASEADFTLSTGYDSYRITGWLKPATDSVWLYGRLSNDGGATFRSGASDYTWLRHYATPTAHDRANDAADSEIDLGGQIGNAAGENIKVDIVVEGAHSTGVRTGLLFDTWFKQPSGDDAHITGGADVIAAEEVNDAIRLFFSSGNIASGRLTLMGVKDSTGTGGGGGGSTGFEIMAASTFGSSTAVDIALSTGFSWLDMQLDIRPLADADVEMQFGTSTSTGIDTGANYEWYWHAIVKDGTQSSTASTGATQINIGGGFTNEGANAESHSHLRLNISRYDEAAHTWIDGTFVRLQANGFRSAGNGGGRHAVASAIDTIRLTSNSTAGIEGKYSIMGWR